MPSYSTLGQKNIENSRLEQKLPRTYLISVMMVNPACVAEISCSCLPAVTIGPSENNLPSDSKAVFKCIFHRSFWNSSQVRASIDSALVSESVWNQRSFYKSCLDTALSSGASLDSILKCLFTEAVWIRCWGRASRDFGFCFRSCLDSYVYLQKLSGHGAEVARLPGLGSCFRSCLDSTVYLQKLSGLGAGVARLPGLPGLPQPVPRQSTGGPTHGGRFQVNPPFSLNFLPIDTVLISR